ncbi:MAG TPA: RagB/SusD family nutrient uptake outer membrane protein [Chitinophagaceae bacterium]|nr:RagB/SusD family nutrient uptake outer membrane protein [Chitinophagaceae bacterium]
MKNIFIRSTVICFAALMLGGGCKKFLDQEVPGAFPEQDFYKTDVDASQAVIGVYDMMQAHYNSNWASIYMIKSLLSDESNAGGSNSGDQPGYQTLDNYNFDAANDKVRDAWRMAYFTIYRANKVINKVEQATELRKRLVAEAKVLRAFNYFELVTLWGDVPLVTDDIPPTNYTATGRKSVAEVYAQIEKDLTEAIPVLPLKSQYTANDKFRVSKGTAQALLGKVYLYQKKSNEAVTQFDAVINSKEYSLASSVGAAFSRNHEFGPESVFEVSYTNERSYDWGNFPWGAAPESNIHIQLMGPRSDYYTKAPADSLIGGWGFILPKQKMWDAFVNAGDVERRRNTVMSVGELIAAGGNWSEPDAYDYEGFFQRKYGSFTSQTGTPIGELNYGTNWRQIRYADVLLMAAEANYLAANEPKARGYLNEVRQRSNLPDVTASGAALMNAIMLERQLELAFEGFRFTDLVRWGLAAQELGPLGFKPNKHELLPIPDYDVKTGGLTQNKGY